MVIKTHIRSQVYFVITYNSYRIISYSMNIQSYCVETYNGRGKVKGYVGSIVGWK